MQTVFVQGKRPFQEYIYKLMKYFSEDAHSIKIWACWNNPTCIWSYHGSISKCALTVEHAAMWFVGKWYSLYSGCPTWHRSQQASYLRYFSGGASTLSSASAPATLSASELADCQHTMASSTLQAMLSLPLHVLYDNSDFCHYGKES